MILTSPDGEIERTGPSSWSVRPNSSHCCGLHGYNPMLGDTCPACDEVSRLWQRRYEIKDKDDLQDSN